MWLSKCLCIAFVLLPVLVILIRFSVNMSDSSLPFASQGLLRLKRVFPLRKVPSQVQDTIYHILGVRQSAGNLCKYALLHVWNVDSRKFQLHFTWPFSFYSIETVVYEAEHNFSWTANAALTILIVSQPSIESEPAVVNLFELTNLSQGTLGSWHARSIFRFKSRGQLQLSANDSGSEALIADATSLYGLKINLIPKAALQSFTKIVLQNCPVQITSPDTPFVLPPVFPTDLNKIFISIPFYRQTDGIIRMYPYENNWKKMGPSCDIAPTDRAEFFGASVAAGKTWLFVGAPFAKGKFIHGEGAVYGFRHHSNGVKLITKLHCPDLDRPHSEQSLSILHFGYRVDMSCNEKFLVTTADNNKIFVYQLTEDSIDLFHVFQNEIPLSKHFGKYISIDNAGNLLFADHHHCYFYTHNVLADEPTRIITTSNKIKRRSLRDVSPNRLRLSRKQKLSKMKKSVKVAKKPSEPLSLRSRLPDKRMSHGSIVDFFVKHISVGFDMEHTREVVNWMS